MSKRLIIILLLIAAPVFAQKQLKRLPQPPATDAIDRQAQLEDESDPRLMQERREMDRQMFQMRESLIHDAMNKMNNNRYNNGNGHEDFHRVLGNVGAFLVFVILLSSVLWLIRTIIESRRWSRVASIQTEIHNKLLEKMASNQELLAYMETEAGKRFLESSPFEVERSQAPIFPYGRIMLSAQAGIVALTVGAGLLWLQDRLPDYSQPLLVFGTLGFALGIGLVISAFISYSMSKHFGLTQGSQE